MFSFRMCMHRQVKARHSCMENGFVGQRVFFCLLWLFRCSYLWEIKRQQVFFALCLLSVPEIAAMAFHHPKQVKTAALIAEVSALSPVQPLSSYDGCLDSASPIEGHKLSKYHFLLSVLDCVPFLLIVQLLSLLHWWFVLVSGL